MNITVIQADFDAAIAIAKDLGLETTPDTLLRGVAGVRIAALENAARVAEEAFDEVVKATNEHYRAGLCTYNELKVAVNNAGHVRSAVTAIRRAKDLSHE